MKTVSRSNSALCLAFGAYILASSVPAVAEVDRATGLEGATASLQASTEEAANAEATGVGMRQETPVQSIAEVPDKPTRQIQRSGVMVGSASDANRREAPTPDATGIGR